jgi:hypothetical protein
MKVSTVAQLVAGAGAQRRPHEEGQAVDKRTIVDIWLRNIFDASHNHDCQPTKILRKCGPNRCARE